jgi:hypothetical protein
METVLGPEVRNACEMLVAQCHEQLRHIPSRLLNSGTLASVLFALQLRNYMVIETRASFIGTMSIIYGIPKRRGSAGGIIHWLRDRCSSPVRVKNFNFSISSRPALRSIQP